LLNSQDFETAYSASAFNIKTAKKK
jgi:hypothetical protein